MSQKIAKLVPLLAQLEAAQIISRPESLGATFTFLDVREGEYIQRLRTFHFVFRELRLLVS